MTDLWFHLHLNPERWATGQLSIGRKAKKIYPKLSPDPQLRAYQAAVKEEMMIFANETMLPMMEPGWYDLAFWFWRRRETYQGETRKVTKLPVDLTNLQKGLEDALQKVLFDNDRNVRHIESTLVEQDTETTPLVVIRAKHWEGFNEEEIPHDVWARIYEAQDAVEPLNQFSDAEDVPF